MLNKYIALGFAVLPCRGKIPATAHGYKDATKDPEKIKSFTGNIGIATGAVSNIFVLDVDVKKSAGGDKSLAALEEKHGKLPETLTAKTWSGGLHYYFKYPSGGVNCKAGFLPGLDIRGDGGYVVCPPSIVEDKNVAPYRGKYEWLNDFQITDAPEWLLALIKDAKAAPKPDNQIITQNRNSTLTTIAGKFRAAGMDAPGIYQALSALNNARCSPPLPDREVRTISESVGRYTPSQKIGEPLTDVWNSEQLAATHGHNVRWCDKLGGWHFWDGTCWRNDDETLLVRWSKDLVKSWHIKAATSDDNELKKHAVRCESAARLSAMVELLKSENDILTPLESFDKNIYLLNCKNGTLDLKTGEIAPARREDMITRRIETAYNPDAQCPTWLNFLDEIFLQDAELVEYVQKAIGYCLSGDIREQKFFLCWGNGRNGKSTFLKHIMYILAPGYASGTPAETMLESNNSHSLRAIASLVGMRYVILNEFDEGKFLSAAQVKNLTGGEPVVGCHLYHAQFTYTPTYKFWMSTNFKPRIKDTSLGIWRRLVLLPFEYTVPAEKQDVGLDDKIAAEYEGILAWAVQGFQKWRKDGLSTPLKLKAVVDTYKADSDLIGQFLEEMADPEIVEPVTTVTEFMKSFAFWAHENNIRFSPGRAAVIDYMEKHGYGKPAMATKRGIENRLAWNGIALRKNLEC